MKNEAEVEFVEDGGDPPKLQSFRLQTELAFSTVEIRRSSSNTWVVSVTEPSGAVNEVTFSSDTEIEARIGFD
jgi:hypothetical protein